MAKQTQETIICDICNDPATESLAWVKSRRMDAAGSMENVWYEIDVCALHFMEISRTEGFPLKRNFRGYITFGSTDRAWRQKLAAKCEMMKSIWKQMSPAERRLAREIESLNN